MKKILMMILMAAVVTPSLAQYQSHRESSRYNRSDTERYYGLRLGLNIASLSSDIVESDLNSRSGLAVGGVVGFQLSNATPIWLETGLFYSEKGGRSTFNGEEMKCRLIYLQAPVVCKYTFHVADDLFISPFLGGYLALGIGGKTKYYEQRISYDSFDEANRFDGGLRIGCGAEYQMVYAEVGIDFGLTNISKNDFASTHTRSFFVNVGVNF